MQNNFERGQIDTFFLEVARERDCGYPLEKLVVELQESITLGADWHLDWIEVGGSGCCFQVPSSIVARSPLSFSLSLSQHLYK